MQNLWSHPLLRSRYLLAVLAGLALAAAVPRLGIAGLGWGAAGMMVVAALGKRGWVCFRIGYVAGLVHYLAMLYWLLLIPYRWHGVPLGPALGWFALSAYMAMFPAAWVWLVSEMLSPQRSPLGAQPSSGGVEPGLGRVLAKSWAGRALCAVAGAAIWVALEMTITRLLGGFPWDLLGVSQYQLIPLIQIASVTGVYGVSFVMVWFSLSLVSAGVMLIRRPTVRSAWVMELFLPLLVVAGLFHFGVRQINRTVFPPRTLKVTLVQPSIPQTVIWNPGADAERFTVLLRLCEDALTNRTDLLIWPESALPKLLRWDRETFESVTGLARRHHVWMIVGADDMERRPGAKSPDDADYYNSSFLINPEGELAARYIKRSLVIFGEYVPFQRWLPFLKWFTPIEGGFTPGKGTLPFDMKDLDVKTSVLICFEDIFPQLGREGVKADTDFLVNITNDGWFGESAAQWQQAATGAFRAVENRVPLVRCTNNGLTCWIDALGRMRDIFHDRNGSVYGAGLMTVEIPVSAAGESHEQTFYNRHGDWFGWACVGIAGVVTFLASRARAARALRPGSGGRAPE